MASKFIFLKTVLYLILSSKTWGKSKKKSNHFFSHQNYLLEEIFNIAIGTFLYLYVFINL